MGTQKSKLIDFYGYIFEDDLLAEISRVSKFKKASSWKSFIFDSYNLRLNEMLEVIDSLAFMNMDERLLKLLKDKCMVLGVSTLEITHQQIAQELNSSREVISRLLKKMEQQNLVKLARNKLELLNL